MLRLALLGLQCVMAAASGCSRCTDHTPAAAGTFSGHTFVPDSGCYLGVPEVDDIFALLAGSWLATVGGSNAWGTWNALANRLGPNVYPWLEERYQMRDKAGYTDFMEAQFADLIWERQADGSWSLIHNEYVCRWVVCQANASEYHSFDLDEAMLNPAGGMPAHSPDRIRLSFYRARVYPESDAMMTYMGSGSPGCHCLHPERALVREQWALGPIGHHVRRLRRSPAHFPRHARAVVRPVPRGLLHCDDLVRH